MITTEKWQKELWLIYWVINCFNYKVILITGGIGVWHGHSLVRMPGTNGDEDVRPYGPLSLFSAVPSRPFFPRGFLWDEGFHDLLIRKFDPLLSLQVSL